MRDFVYLHPNNLMRSALQPTGKSRHKQNETNATNCRTARCNLIILTMQNKEIHTSGGQKRPHQPKVSGKFLLLDTRLLNSPDLFRLRETMGMEGWGMALFVLNYLLEHGEWGRAPLHAVTDLARMCHKNKRSMMALLTDYPTLFEIEVGGKVFNSPYLRQCLGGEKIKINQKSCGLETLTNEPSDNQALSLHRIKDERIKKKNDEEKETTAADAAEAVAKKAEKGAKQPAASGTKEAKMVGHLVASGAKQRVTSGTEEVKMVGRPVVKGAKQRVTSAAKASPATNALPHPLTEVAPLAPEKAAEESAQHMEQATTSPTNSTAKAANAPEKAMEESAQHVEQATASPTNSAAKAANAPEKAAEESAQHVEQATASPTNSAAKAANAPEKAAEESAQHVEQATASPTNSAAKARAKAMGENAQHVEQATASSTGSAAKAANASAKAAEEESKHAGQVAKQPGFRLETVFTDLAQAARKLPDDERQPLRTTWEILAQLYADSLYWQSLERLVGLEVYSQKRWKRLALRWFFTYCVTQAKPIAALNDAKSYLNHLLQPGRNTRQAFEHYAQTQYEADCRAWQHYRQMQENVVASGSNDVSKP